MMFKIGPLSRLLKEADAQTGQNVRDAIRKLFEEYHPEAGVIMASASWIVSARNS